MPETENRERNVRSFCLVQKEFFYCYWEVIMRLGFIGAGAVGTALGVFLRAKGSDVIGYYSKTYDHALSAAKRVNALAYPHLDELLDACDCIIVSVNDDSISDVSKALSICKGLQGKVVVHTSGAMNEEPLLPLKKKGAYVGSLHPLQSFADLDSAVNDLSTSYFALEGDFPEAFHQWINGLCIKIIPLMAHQKTQYHMAAVIASNYLVSVLAFAVDEMQEIGVDRDTAQAMLAPLIQGASRNVLTIGVDKALTGPIVRGDAETVRKHLYLLSGEKKKLYQLLGLEAMKVSVRRGLPIERATMIKKLLESR